MTRSGSFFAEDFSRQDVPIKLCRHPLSSPPSSQLLLLLLRIVGPSQWKEEVLQEEVARYKMCDLYYNDNSSSDG